ncbi:hypothetical protein [Ectopseudomonas toyotomiensis]|uniref:hypothetical protein n=1 Tax=Ectopseudomonas toyotomiensis TaxID=554344 RepID=UPI0018C3D13F|nr:hypothetical protein [Pseudomonas toyotomiensis]MBG0839017.1 hypothetical protein [Pseudomonas toyotomiensis]
MKPVRVRFACKPDPVVRRRLISEGEVLPAGQTKTIIFRGYLCKLVADQFVCVADVIDMPVRLLGFRGPLFRLGEFSPLAFTVAGKREQYAPDGAIDEPLSAKLKGKWFSSASHGNAVVARSYVGAVMPPRYGDEVVRASMSLAFQFIPADQTMDGFFNGCDTQQFQLGLQVIGGGPRLDVVIRESWFGLDGLTFATAYSAKTLPALVDAPSPAGPFESPYRPRWSVPQPRQVAMPAVQPVVVDEQQRYTLGVQVAFDMPDNHFILADKGDGAKWYSLQYPHAKAARSGFMVLEFERRAYIQEDIPTGVAVDYSTVDAVPEWAQPIEPTAPPAQYLFNALREMVPNDDWPAHLQQTPFVPELRIAPPLFTTDFSLIEYYPDLSGQDCYRPCVVGAVHATELDGVVEFVASVRAGDEYLLPITTELRFDDSAGITPGEAAKVKVTRTGLLVVSYTVATGAITTRMMAPDVLGSDQCPWYDSGEMDPAIAYYPQVLWGGVVDGKRCYAVRALRYLRSVWLGSLLQDVDGGWWWFTDNYRGWRRDSTEDIRPPLYRTDLGFGPYIDRDQPEELWWIVDDVLQRVTPPAGYRVVTRARQTSFAVEGQNNLSAYLAELYAHMGIFGGPGLSDVVWQEYALEEYLLPNTLQQQFAPVAADRVVYFLPPSEEPGVLVLQVFDGGAVADYGTVAVPWVNGTHYTSSENRYPVYALTCYQRETWLDGELVTPAGLILTVTSGARGYALISRDGAATWQPLVNAPDSFDTGQNSGIPGHGYIFAGTALWKPEPGYPYVKEISNG